MKLETYAMTETTVGHAPSGRLALIYCGLRLEHQVLRSAAGYYIGTLNEDMPCSRESAEYFKTQAQADDALATGHWTQREWP